MTNSCVFIERRGVLNYNPSLVRRTDKDTFISDKEEEMRDKVNRSSGVGGRDRQSLREERSRKFTT